MYERIREEIANIAKQWHEETTNSYEYLAIAILSIKVGSRTLKELIELQESGRLLVKAESQGRPRLATTILDEPLEFLRRNNPEAFAAGAHAAYGAMLTPKDGCVWVRCLEKEEHES